jgi:hypothetical protein
VTAVLAFGEAASERRSRPRGRASKACSARTCTRGSRRRVAARGPAPAEAPRPATATVLRPAGGGPYKLDAGDAAAALELLGKSRLASSSPGNESPSRRSARTRRRCSRRASWKRLRAPLAGRRSARGARRSRSGSLRAPARRSGRADRARSRRRGRPLVARSGLGITGRRRRGGGARSAPNHRAGRPAEYHARAEATPVPWLDAAARSLVLLECCDHWLFVQMVDLAVGRVRTCAVIRTPEPLDNPTTAISPRAPSPSRLHRGCSNSPWRHGIRCLGARAGHSASMRSLNRSRSRQKVALCGRTRHAISAPRGELGWWIWSGDAWCARCRTARGFGRSSEPASPPWPIPEARYDPIAPSSRRCTDGRRKNRASASVCHALVHPSDGRLLVFVGEGGKDGQRLGFVEVDADGPPVGTDLARRCELEAPCGPSPPRSSSTPASSWLSETTADLSLHALRAPGVPYAGGAVYRASLPVGIRLARDPSSRHVVALVPDYERCTSCRSGRNVRSSRAASPIQTPSCAGIQYRLHVYHHWGRHITRRSASFGPIPSGRRWRGCSDGSRRPAPILSSF